MKKLFAFIGLLLPSFLFFSGCQTDESQKTEEKSISEKTETKKQAQLKNFSAISYEKFQEQASQENAVVIDIRTPGEINNFALPEKTIDLDFYAPDFGEKIAQLDKEKTYLLYCRSGSRTNSTKRFMKELNFTSVYDLKGGIISL